MEKKNLYIDFDGVILDTITQTYADIKRDLDNPTPEESVMMNERQKAVRDAINSLSDEYREIIVYSDINQLSYDEISKMMKCPGGTVKSRLNRARNALRKILSEKRELF